MHKSLTRHVHRRPKDVALHALMLHCYTLHTLHTSLTWHALRRQSISSLSLLNFRTERLNLPVLKHSLLLYRLCPWRLVFLTDWHSCQSPWWKSMAPCSSFHCESKEQTSWQWHPKAFQLVEVIFVDSTIVDGWIWHHSIGSSRMLKLIPRFDTSQQQNSWIHDADIQIFQNRGFDVYPCNSFTTLRGWIRALLNAKKTFLTLSLAEAMRSRSAWSLT